MINKKILLGLIMLSIIVIGGFVKINIINTNALSPIGNSESNYEKITNEFGEEFEEFIKDNSYIKIYGPRDTEERITVKIGEKEVFIKSTNIVIEKGKEYYTDFINGYEIVKNNIVNKKNAKENEENKNIEEAEENDESINVNLEINVEEREINNSINVQNNLDKIVDEFIKSKE